MSNHSLEDKQRQGISGNVGTLYSIKGEWHRIIESYGSVAILFVEFPTTKGGIVTHQRYSYTDCALNDQRVVSTYLKGVYRFDATTDKWRKIS